MSWWSRLRSWFGGSSPASGAEVPAVSWLAADQNPFGVPVLDLSPVTRTMLSMTSNPTVAAKAASWGRSTGAELDPALPPGDPVERPCALRYPAAAVLPEGLLFVPEAMEDKWVLAWRDGKVLFARSWTGDVLVVADARRDEDGIVLERIRYPADLPGLELGDPVQIVDWMFRTHALQQVLPLPVDDAGADLLQQQPILAVSLYGRRALCAARSWEPPPPDRPVRSDGAALQAVLEDDAAALRALAARGEPLEARGTRAGYTPLHAAVLRDNRDTAGALLDLGVDPDRCGDRGMSPLGIGLVQGTSLDLLGMLVERGADPAWANDDGFGLLHACAEVDRADALEWLMTLGLDLEARTKHGYTPLHIAAAHGHLAVLEGLLEAGASPHADSKGGTPADVARAEGKPEAAALLDRYTS